MSYSQKIINLLKSLKNTKNNSNIQRYSRNNALIKEENNINNCKKISFKKYKNKYKTSNNNDEQDIIIDCIKFYEDENDINKKPYKYNNNFIMETSYQNNKSKRIHSNLHTSNSCKNNVNLIQTKNRKKSTTNNNCDHVEKKMFFSKIRNNKYNNIYYNDNNNNNNNMNNSDDKICNKINKKIHDLKNYSSVNNGIKKKLSSYILKNTNNNEKQQYVNSNSLSFNFSSFFNKKKNASNPKFNVINENNENNSYKNISSRIIKRQHVKSLTELFDDDKICKITKIKSKSKYKYIKQKILMIDKEYNGIEPNNSKRQYKYRNCNSSNNIKIKEVDNHSGGKIILALNEKAIKSKRKKRIKTYIYYVIMIQTFWRGYTFRKLIKITKELLLLFIPFINIIDKIIKKY